MARRAEAASGSEAGTAEFDRWSAPLAQAARLTIACVATAFGIAYAVNRPILITLLRSPQHHIRRVQGREIGM
jgi:hypothetical protein